MITIWTNSDKKDISEEDALFEKINKKESLVTRLSSDKLVDKLKLCGKTNTSDISLTDFDTNASVYSITYKDIIKMLTNCNKVLDKNEDPLYNGIKLTFSEKYITGTCRNTMSGISCKIPGECITNPISGFTVLEPKYTKTLKKILGKCSKDSTITMGIMGANSLVGFVVKEKKPVEAITDTDSESTAAEEMEQLISAKEKGEEAPLLDSKTTLIVTTVAPPFCARAYETLLELENADSSEYVIGKMTPGIGWLMKLAASYVTINMKKGAITAVCNPPDGVSMASTIGVLNDTSLLQTITLPFDLLKESYGYMKKDIKVILNVNDPRSMIYLSDGNTTAGFHRRGEVVENPKDTEALTSVAEATITLAETSEKNEETKELATEQVTKPTEDSSVGQVTKPTDDSKAVDVTSEINDLITDLIKTNRSMLSGLQTILELTAGISPENLLTRVNNKILECNNPIKVSQIMEGIPKSYKTRVVKILKDKVAEGSLKKGGRNQYIKMEVNDE